MKLYRKRFRPLEPVEERSINTDQPLDLCLLDDERSYCFSWPDASLTTLLTSFSTYAETHIYNQSANESGEKKTSHKNRVYTGDFDSVIGTTAGYVGFQAISFLPASFGVVPSVHRLVFDDRPKPEGDPGSGTGVRGLDLSDMSFLLEPMLLAEKNNCAAAFPITVQGLGSSSHFHWIPTSNKKQKETCNTTPLHGLHNAEYEDGIFSLEAEQLNDAYATGLLSRTSPLTPEKELLHGCHLVHTGAQGNGKSDVNTEAQTTHADVSNLVYFANDGGPSLQRRRLEDEVVVLERRAYQQSKQTAAALHRLLSLEAAVPFEFVTRLTEVSAPGNVANSMEKQPGDDDNAVTEAWRMKVYRQWLQWRLCMSTRKGASDFRLTQEGDRALSTASRSHHAVFSQALLPKATLLSQTDKQLMEAFYVRYPWGPPLLAEAYLYSSQNEYFIDSQHAGISTTAQPTSLGFSSPLDTAAFVVSRRRGVYNFLRWRIELYTPRLIQAAGSFDYSVSASQQRARASTSFFQNDMIEVQRRTSNEDIATNDLSKDHTASGGRVSRAQSSCNMLGNAEVNLLVNREVLARPLIEIQQDVQQDRLEVLERKDLKHDVELWRGWLAKV